MDKLNATKYYADVVNTYNSFPTTFTKINPDLPSYVVGKAVGALFDQIAKEDSLRSGHNPSGKNRWPFYMFIFFKKDCFVSKL